MCNVGAAQYQLSHDPPDLGDVQKTLEEIVTADHRATEIIRGLRLLYRQGSVHMQPLDLNDLVRELLKLVRPDMAKWEVDWSTELASELPAVNGDARLIRSLRGRAGPMRVGSRSQWGVDDC